ncbi:MAG: SBBP repeat-containing protein [Candidatus Zixiibacteriota bacterium]|nr:MAG: SBBP repeat-containing protein [candidate division Zixibacteria bacterium]
MLQRKLIASSLLFTTLLLMVLFSAGQLGAASDPGQNQSPFFTENVGQWDSHIRFKTGSMDATAWFADDGTYYQFSREIIENKHPDAMKTPVRESIDFECLMIKASFIGTSAALKIVGEEMLDYKCNYFLGNDQTRWQTNVPNYSSILYRNIYNGINLRYYGNGSELEYDFIVAPGVDPSQIQIRYDGIESLAVNGDGELEVTTLWGTIIESCPYIYQVDGDEQIELSGSYELISDNSFGFAVDAIYDARLPVVIDPILTYSTYFGGTRADYAVTLEIDDARNVYIAGVTSSSDFPLLFPYQATYGGSIDAFVTKMELDGTLLFSTYFGGVGAEEWPTMALDDEFNIYISGRTFSSDFPAYLGYSNEMNGNSDLFAFKLNSTGDQLIYSSFLGGSADEYAGYVDVDPNRRFYVFAITESDDYPLVNHFQTYPSQNPVSYDLCLTRFNTAGNDLEYSTYLGGTEDESALGIAVDAAGCAHVCGYTYSPEFPVENPYDAVQEGCDGFITKFSPEGNSLIFGTFFGGTENDWIEAIDVDGEGGVYVTGSTRSDDFPLVNPFQSEFRGGVDLITDLFASKFNSTGTTLIYSTYLGGTGDDFVEKILIDDLGVAIISGYTYSADFPLVNPLFSDLNGIYDASLSALGPTGNELTFGTYLGGSETEIGWDLAVDEVRNVYLVGFTKSPDFPLVDPIQTTLKGTFDGFVAIIELGCCVGMSGNADHDPDDLVSILDADYLISWMHRGGPEPLCFGEADLDGSGALNILDVDYLVNYLFRDGPPPVICE